MLDKWIKKITERIESFRHSGLALYETYKTKLISKIPEQQLRIMVGVVVACLAVGFFLGHGMTKKFSFTDSFKKRVLFPGVQTDGSYILSNFENPGEADNWNLMAAKVSLSTNYAWEGTKSGQITFSGGKEIAAVSLEDLGKGKSKINNWSKYGALQFYIFHPGTQTDQLTLMITDLEGKKFEEKLSIPKGTWVKFAIPVSKMASLDVKKINQLSFSRRGTSEAAEFYLDGLRLIPSSVASGMFSKENIFDYGFAKRKAFWSVFDQQLNSEVIHVPFVVKNETNAFCQLCPGEGGIPFPMNELKDLKAIRLRNAFGEDLPFQAKALAYWPDQSIKWLSLNFETTLNPDQGEGFFLDYGHPIKSIDFSSPMNISETNASLQINTGPLEVTLNKQQFYLYERIRLDQNSNHLFESNEEVSSQAKLTLTFKGKEYRTDLDRKTYKLEVEEKGPLKIVVKASGWYQSEDGNRFCQAIVRYYFYQGKSNFKISHTLIYTGYPENKQYGAYEMLHLPDNEPIESYELKIPYHFSTANDEKIYMGLSHSEPRAIIAGDRVSLYQKNYDEAVLNQDVQVLPMEDTFLGWMDLSNATEGIALSLRHFRENFPKAFKVNRLSGELEISLWPKETGLLDLSTTPKSVGPEDYGRGNAFGLAKTHEVMLYFHKGNAADSNAFNQAQSFLEPFLIRTNPYWVDATGALGRLFPVDSKYATQEKMLERLFDWAERQPRNYKWYGMLNFGDTLTWMRQDDGDTPGGTTYPTMDWNPSGRWGWYNCEGIGTHFGALLQFVRSGEWKYFEFGENLTKHIMDVDTIHYDTVSNDKRIKGQISERYSRVGAMHRHSGDHWGGRTDEASHTNVAGILLYYYLTGNERAFDVAKEVGEYFLTEPFTYMDRPDLAPNRAMANAMWGEILLYQATWDDRYKKAADKILKIFLQGQQTDGSYLENYNAIFNKWEGSKHELYMGGYVIWALMTYHELTQDPAVKEAFLKLVRYLAPTEFTGPTILQGIAYAYSITKDPFFITMAERNLKQIMDNQKFSDDPVLDGLIYEKPIYHRPMAFLSTVPYVFGALEDYYNEQQQQQQQQQLK